MKTDFPLLEQDSRGFPLVYLDNAATTQKPKVVIDAITEFYQKTNANVHRGAHEISIRATEIFEESRVRVSAFINAERPQEIIFTSGTTESINLLANCLQNRLSEGDEILITLMEHHSNIVPWQMACERTGAKLMAVDVDDQGNLDWSDLTHKLTDKTKIFAFTHVSNALGTVNPAYEMVQLAKQFNVITVVDGAQAALHEPLNMRKLDCDFYAFSGHKVFAPTGVGVLYGKYDLLSEMPPWQGGGEMIESVSIANTTYQSPPYKFEAGTPAIAEVIGLGRAIEYINTLDRGQINQKEQALVKSAANRLSRMERVNLIGNPDNRQSVISFLVDGSHPHDVGQILDQQGVAVRSGHHCTMPLMARLKIPGTVRASFSLYSDDRDADRLVETVEKATDLL
jgi:cysteine desulfurase/selenocysteine lyase